MVGKGHCDVFAVDFNVNFPSAGVDDHVDFSLIHCNGNIADNAGRNSKLFERSFNITGSCAGSCEVVARNVIVKLYGLHYAPLPPLKPWE